MMSAEITAQQAREQMALLALVQEAPWQADLERDCNQCNQRLPWGARLQTW